MIYGYGIINKDGNPWWDENCVCADREPLDEVVENLNDNPDINAPYRVVELTF